MAIIGGSNGGLLMGAALTQHPEMYHAVVSMVGIYDMLRVELSPNGSFNVSEFGTVKEADQFRALLAYSPYHHVQNGTAYPSVLVISTANDDRVDPMHARKFVAALQKANLSDHMILLRTFQHAGHGGADLAEAKVDEWTDRTVFLMHELGMELRGSEQGK